ncbi:MAG: hypothetical protein HY512_01930 [Candidatus Aenigmarchaeota archaeon]|nr:hypothetical protein [Candidatus Aenigmarchaeota archaeon]
MSEEAQLENQPEPVEGQPAEAKIEPVEEEVSEEEEAKEKLPFPTATIVRLMRAHLDKDKIIKKDVKIGMNKWLGGLVARVSKDLNKIPYTTLHLHEFRESIKVYLELQEFYKEKERILAHLDAIKKDIQRLERDLGKEEEGQLVG